MKKIFISALAVCLVLSSCELERMPHSGYTPEQLSKNPSALKILLTGIYGQMKGMADATHRIAEMPGDNTNKDKSSTDDFMDYFNYNHRVRNNSRTANVWNNCYKVIAQTSEIMTLVDEGAATPEVTHMLAEAYYLRGLSYFFLVRSFGKPYYQSPETNLGVPIINGKPEDVLGGNLTLPDRATVKVVYEQILADLKKAETLFASIPDVTKSNNYASKEAAQAMLSRVYLYMSGTFDNPNQTYVALSIEYSNKVIASPRFEMLSREEFMKYNVTLPENNKETIFAIKRTDTDIRTSPGHYYTFGGMYSNAGGAGWNEMAASEKYMDRLRLSGGDVHNVWGATAADARGSFIRPYYVGATREQVESGQKPTTGTDVFRFVADQYRLTVSTDPESEAVLQTFIYRQLEFKAGAENMVVETITYNHDGDANTDPIKETFEYPITKLDNGRYEIDDYQYRMVYTDATSKKQQILKLGPVTTYVGDVDKMISEVQSMPKFAIFKCSLEGGLQQTHSPIISRKAEMYLNLAEAYVKKGELDLALTNLNVIRNRAVESNPITSAQLSANPVAVVMNERSLELAWEAHSGLDTFRNGLPMVRRYPSFMFTTNGVQHNLVTIPATSDLVVQLLENATLNAYAPYGGLTQNPIPTLPAADYTTYTPYVPY